MDKTLQLRDEQTFNEFAYGEALGVADRQQGLVHVGVQLRAYVLALEAHACADIPARTPFCNRLMVS